MFKDVHFHIDSPVSWEMESYDFSVRGWCADLSGNKIHSIRLRCGEQTVEGVYGLGRPDVADFFKVKGLEECGFEIHVRLKSGRQEIILDIQDVDGRWHELIRVDASIPLASLAANIDTPDRSVIAADSLVRVSGWCCHPQHKILGISVRLNGATVEANYGIERNDVGDAYPNFVNSLKSGFEASFYVNPGRGQISVEAALDNGSVLSYVPDKVYKAVPPSLFVRLLRLFKLIAAFIAFSFRAGKKWKSRHRRLPGPRELLSLFKKALSRFRVSQSKNIHGKNCLPEGFKLPKISDPYKVWLEFNRWNSRSEALLRKRLSNFKKSLPKISVVMPVYNPPVEYLERAVASVCSQVYENWELCIADDASTDPGVQQALERIKASDPRIRAVYRKTNGNISLATNSAAELASGEFLLFLDNDDELTPDALGEVASYIGNRPETDFLYSDDDKIGTDGERFAPQFKPDWSPELLLSYMYMSHLIVVRRELFEKLGGMRVGYEGSQDYDFALRATEKARHVGHIPLVLYHWRVLPGSTAMSGDAKPKSIDSGRKAVQDTFDRRSLTAQVYQPEWAEKERLGIFCHKFPDSGPKVAIIIPTKNKVSILRKCLESLPKTAYSNYHVLIIDNESDDPETLHYLNNCSYQVERIPNPDGRFNFAYINNEAARRVDAEYLLFLNNDVEITNPYWLSSMAGYAQIPGVGAVGARLLFPDTRIQHAGIVHGFYHGMAGPAFKLSPEWNRGYLSYAMVTRNYSAVTAACLLTPRKLFLSMGGFDEKNFAVAYNDVDYCYRLYDQGHRIVYTPLAQLIHHEGYSRGFNDNPLEEALFRRKHSSRIDPMYSPHLSLADENFRIVPRRFIPDRSVNKPVRTFMTAFNLNLEGAPYSQYELTVKLKDKGVIDPLVYCPDDGPLRSLYEDKGISVQVFKHPLRNIYTISEYEAAILEFSRYIESTGAELLYGNTLQTFYAIDAAKQAGVPSIWNPRESEPWQSYFANFGPDIAARALGCFSNPYRVIFVADATRDVYAPLNSKSNFTVIHNGLDIERLNQISRHWTHESARSHLGVEKHQIVLLLLGTVCARKGQHDLPMALKLLPDKFHDQLKCFVVGDRPSKYSQELARLVADLPETLRRQFHVVPECGDTALYYKAADIFLCASRVESYPRVILEAMAYGLPIVTTPVYGIREQVRPQCNGLHYSPGDVKAMADAISFLVENEDVRKKFGERSRQVIATLTSYEEMVTQYAEIFQEAALT